MRTLAVALTLAVAPIGIAYADTTSLECDGCSVQQMDGVAWDYSLGLRMPSDNILYVLNPSNNIARKYRVMRDREGGPICDKMPPGSVECEPFSIVDSLVVEQAAIDFLAYRRVSMAAGPLWVTEPGYPTTPYDDIQNPQKRDKVDEYLKARFEIYTYAANGAAALGFSVWAPFIIKYADGGESQYNWNAATQKYVPIAVSYKDRFGNLVPVSVEQLSENRGGVTTKFEFPGGADPADIASLINQLNNLGISVSGGSGGSAPTDPKIMICSSSIIGGKVTVSCGWL
ncbi:MULTISPECIES: hypothetical protein [Stenotrophomonas maltophilia group]|uniref:hypothetical protein n=2 Tax=Lysobacteraceae TaxID=32033 RepID=UPI0021BD091F|nr:MULTISPECIES: hypothetical protein [Stenotrophomonas maltophilia group]